MKIKYAIPVKITKFVCRIYFNFCPNKDTEITSMRCHPLTIHQAQPLIKTISTASKTFLALHQYNFYIGSHDLSLTSLLCFIT